LSATFSRVIGDRVAYAAYLEPARYHMPSSIALGDNQRNRQQCQRNAMTNRAASSLPAGKNRAHAPEMARSFPG
jgi:hypothetical protein